MKKFSVIVVLLLIAVGAFAFFYGKDVDNQYILQDKHLSENNIAPGEYVKPLSKEELIEQITDYYDVRSDKPIPHNEQEGVDNDVSVRLFVDEANNSIRDGWENGVFSEIDLLTQRFLSSPESSRAEKIYALWSVVSNAITDFQYRYFVDALISLSPVELADEIIDAYRSTTSITRKIGLLRLMGSFPDVANPSVQTEQQLQYVGDQMAKVRGVFEEEIRANDNELILEEIVHMYPNFAPEKAAVSLLQDLFGREDLVLGQEEKFSAMIELADSTR